MLTICKCINTLSKIFSGSSTKCIKILFIKDLCYHIASYTSNLLPVETLNPYLTSIVDKTHHGPVIAFFFCATSAIFQLHQRCPSNQPFLLFFMMSFGNAANYNTQPAFAITFLICSDIFNYLKSVDIVITRESG